MNQANQRQYRMVLRVQQFGLARPTDFPETSVGGQLFADLSRLIDEMSRAAAEQVEGDRRSTSGLKVAARKALRADLDAISRGALATGQPDLKSRFRLKPLLTDAALLATGRAFAEYAAPLRQQFIDHELPPNFIEDLLADIQAFEQVTGKVIDATNRVVSATSTIQAIEGQGKALVKRLDAIVKNRYRANQPTLDEWARARAVERASRPTPAEVKPAA